MRSSPRCNLGQQAVIRFEELVHYCTAMKSPTACLSWLVVILAELKPCTSTSTDTNIDLSSKNLTSVPSDLPPTVEFLDLSCNLLSQLSREDFRNTSNLRSLNLSWNILEEVDPETFSGAPLLQDLDLSHNHLRDLSGQRYLLHTRNLRVLNLAFNAFLTMTLGREFSSLEKLESLALGANNISVGDFKNITGVKLVSLTLCLEGEMTYEEGSLRDVRAKRLRLDLAKKPTMDHGLLGDSLLLFDELELIRLTDGYNQLARQLGNEAKVHTSHLYMTNLSIKWRKLTQFANEVLCSFKGYLTVSDVAILEPPFFDTVVSKTSNLTSFRVRRAAVMSFFFSQEAVYNYFINMPVRSMSILETSIIHMTCPKSQSPIYQLDFSNCALSDTIFSTMDSQEPLECKNLGNLKNLILHGNNIKNLQVLSKRVQYMSSLQYLDLSLNSLTYDMRAECVWPSNISNMNLSFNGLTDSVFRCLPNRTRILSLRNNQISAVPASLLEMNDLLSLDLSVNRLRDLPVCDGFPSLTILLLTENSLHAPSVHNLQSCPNLKLLDASHNPYICTCPLRSFRSLGINSELNSGQTGTQLLSWPLAYYCSYPEALVNSTLKGIWLPEVSCNAGMLAATILGPAFILVIAMVTLCHRLDVPWYMGMIWQWTRAKYRTRTQQLRVEDMKGVEFHAFVSYSQRDVDWVKNSLLPSLEGPAGGLTICYHERNFIPGKTITENIIRCIEKSRRCVFVLSTHFVKSEWCHYELYFASHQRLAHGADSVVLVLLEPLPQYLIPSRYYQLKTMMERHTYLEWPQDNAKHGLFWANLRAALQSNLPNALLTNRGMTEGGRPGAERWSGDI